MAGIFSRLNPMSDGNAAEHPAALSSWYRHLAVADLTGVMGLSDPDGPLTLWTGTPSTASSPVGGVPWTVLPAPARDHLGYHPVTAAKLGRGDRNRLQPLHTRRPHTVTKASAQTEN